MSEKPSTAPSQSSVPTGRAVVLFVTLLCTVLFVVRLAGPADYMDNDQERPSAYALDALLNGNWIIMVDDTNDVMSKPPFSTWVTALVAWPFGRLNLFLLYLPCYLSTLLISWLILGVTGPVLGRRVAFLSSFVYLLSPVAYAQVALSRSDSVFALLVFAGVVSAWRAWQSGRGWTLFWLLAAASTLTKGPLGLLLAGFGMLAAPWERLRGTPSCPRGSHLPGLILFFLITGGWFALAYLDIGTALTDKMIKKELVGHAVGTDSDKAIPGLEFWKPLSYYFSIFIPWAVLTFTGFWRVLRRPSSDATVRRFERLVFCQTSAGLVLFMLATHHRHLHLWPLMPAAAILAGRELERLVPTWSPRQLMARCAAVAAVSLIVTQGYVYIFRADADPHVETRQIREMAADIRETVGEDFPLLHVSTPYGVQFHLNTMRQRLEYEAAAEALASDYAAFAIARSQDVMKPLVPEGTSLYELAAWQTVEEHYALVANRPEWREYPRMTANYGPILLQMENLRFADRFRKTLRFEPTARDCRLRLVNTSEEDTLRFRVRVPRASPPLDEWVTLEPGKTIAREMVSDSPVAGAPDEPSPVRYALATIAVGLLLGFLLRAGAYRTIEVLDG